MMAVQPLAHLRNLVPYQCGVNKFVDDGFKYRLCYNENCFGPSPMAMDAVKTAMASMCHYPDMEYTELREAVAAKYMLDAGRIVFGVGSDELIYMLADAFVQPGDEVISSQYAFSMYAMAAQAAGATPVIAPENDLCVDLDAMLRAVTPRTRAVYLANPNNPTGSWLSRSDIHHFLRALPEDILFVYDAAYTEYVQDEDYSDGFEWVEEEGRVCVLRTFSKIYGLAGMRVGYAYGSKTIAEALNRVRRPFNISALSQAAALASLQDDGFVEKSRKHSARWREKLIAELQSQGAKPYPSKANFVLTGFASPQQANNLFNHLKAASILVRPMNGYGLPDCLRFTVGQEHEMQALFDALKNFDWS